MSAAATPAARVAVIAIGSELLTLGRADTNSPWIAATLQRHGLRVVGTQVVGDDDADLADALGHALGRADLVVCTGGLGPTGDDRTREAASSVTGLTMHEHADLVAGIRERFGRRGLTMPEINRRQALVPEGASVVPNPRGTAPGLWIPWRDRALLLLPGPPREMMPMLDSALVAHILPRWGGERIVRRSILLAGRSESWVDERAQPVYAPWAHEPIPVTTTILASLGTVELHLTTQGHDEPALHARLDAAVDALATVLGDDIVNTDGRSLEQTLVEALVTRGWRVAVAESCTGGLVTTRLTDVPGASAAVDRAIVAYSNAAKVDVLGVDPEVLAAHGAVSEAVAAAMAEGARARSGVDVAVSITGIAGPGGGSAEKPVGVVCFAVAGPYGTEVRTSRFTGDRAVIRAVAATTALDLLRRYVRAGTTP